MASALVAFGCNLGNRREQIDRALAALQDHHGIELKAVSRYYETAPIGGPSGQGAFLNGALLLETSLGPEPLRQVLASVERQLGRERGLRWQARLLDLDLLLYDNVILALPELTIPHPRMSFRRFVLEPAAEVAGDMVHPSTGWTVGRLLGHLNESPPMLALAGVSHLGKTSIAQELAAEFGGLALTPAPVDHPAGSGSSGRNYQSEIELLAARCELLRATPVMPANPDRLIVTDFWLDQSLVYGSQDLPPEEFCQLTRAWEQAQASAPRPRLVALLTAGPTSPLPREAPADWQRRQAAFVEFVRRPGVGPVLQVSAEPRQNVFAELRAAILAMR